MLYKILWEKEKYVILPLNFDLLKFYLAEKKSILVNIETKVKREKPKLSVLHG